MERLELYEDFRIRAYLVRLKAWRFFPCDMSGEAFQRRKAERRRGLHRQRERERREMLHLKSVADHRNDAVMRILIVKVVAMVPTRRRNPWAGLSAEPPIEIHRGVEVCP
jgi:hypothetical protein